ncbi:MAG: DUF6265 family protein [Urechidicola sp.]|nr:DUF6265 family protein [Urechidicola sp.]
MKKLFTLCFSLLTLIIYAQPNTDIYLFDLDTSNGEFVLSNVKNISDNEGYDNQPSFFDDNTLLYAGTRKGQTDIVQYTIDSSKKKWLTKTDGSEYSPLKIPSENAITAIRLEKDGTQQLYKYNFKNGKSSVLINSIVIGYQTWFNKNTLVTSVLENDMLSLYVSNLNIDKHNKIEANIGRSLHKIPNSNMISFVSKATDEWEIKSLEFVTGKTKFITKTVPKAEDMCWLPDGTIIMGKKNVIYKFKPKKDKEWVEIASLRDFDITNITRLTVNSDGTKLAIAAEHDPTLAPKLENISWISGNWKGEAFGGITEEIWSQPMGDSMMSSFKLVVDDKVSFYEIEIIREVNNTLILQLKHFNNDLKGWETKDETVDFPLIEILPNKVVFEGMTFEKTGDNTMSVFVDMHQKDGSVETMEFKYTKAP